MSIIASCTVDPVIAVYDSPIPSQSAIRALSRAGFDMGKLSIIGKRYRAEERAIGFYSTGDRITAWGGTGGFWATVWSLLAGPAVSFVPQVGLVAAAGPFGLALIAAQDSAAGAGCVSSLVAALVSLGIPADQAMKYEAHIKAHRFLVLVQGSAEDIAKGRSLLAGGVQQAPAAFGPYAPRLGQGRAGAEGATHAGSPARPEWPTHG
jgi:hypothetical protein